MLFHSETLTVCSINIHPAPVLQCCVWTTQTHTYHHDITTHEDHKDHKSSNNHGRQPSEGFVFLLPSFNTQVYQRGQWFTFTDSNTHHIRQLISAPPTSGLKAVGVTVGEAGFNPLVSGQF